MATSPIYSWPEPDNTDLVKNGALAIRTLGDAIDTTMGTMVAKTIVDAKADLIVGTAADTVSRLAVGTNGQVLTADSTVSPTGLKWATASSGGFPASTSFTPTVTSQGGSITTYTASGFYQTSGKLVVATYKIVLTNVGTASGTMSVTLPVTAVTLTNGNWVGSCFEYNNSGKTGAFYVTSAGTTLTSRDYNFGTWFTSGNQIAGTIVYEVA